MSVDGEMPLNHIRGGRPMLISQDLKFRITMIMIHAMSEWGSNIICVY